jgi:hypothetical protein
LTRAFSSEVDPGSREENASNKKREPRSDSIGTEKALRRVIKGLEDAPRLAFGPGMVLFENRPSLFGIVP